MKIQVNTDHHITGTEFLNEEVSAEVESVLSHLSSQITRVEVHIGDENGDKGGDSDIRCMMEARPTHHQPVAVRAEAAGIAEAVSIAAEKLKNALEHKLGKMGRG